MKMDLQWAVTLIALFAATLCDGFQRARHRAVNQLSLFSLHSKTTASTNEIAVLPKKRKGVYLDESSSQRNDRFNQIWKALTIYKQLNNDVDVPSKFVVPESDDWPSDLKDLPLGKYLFRIKYRGDFPQYNEKFASIGFQINKQDYKFELFMKALSTYKDLHEGKTTVPRFFVVPDTAPWPEECYGMKLGVKVSSTRTGRSHFSPECIQRLNELGFVWEYSSNAASVFIQAVEAFKNHHGHLQIPKDYVVPRQADVFPPCTWGLKIGSKAQNVMYRGDFGMGMRGKFHEMGLRISKKGFDTRHWDYIYSALQIYKSVYGDVQVKPNFMVPFEDPWPEDIRGLKLGFRLRNIRYRGDFINERPECQKLLEELGFNCGKVRNDSWLPAKPKRQSKKSKNKGGGSKNANSFADSLLDLLPLSQELELLKMKEFIEADRSHQQNENSNHENNNNSLVAAPIQQRKPTKQQQIAQLLVDTDEAFKRIDDSNASIGKFTNSSRS